MLASRWFIQLMVSIMACNWRRLYALKQPWKQKGFFIEIKILQCKLFEILVKFNDVDSKLF